MDEKQNHLMCSNGFLVFASVSGALAVMAGAFGAHWLKDHLDLHQLSSFETGVRYQFYHSLALIAVHILLHYSGNKLLIRAGYLFATGIILFSGSIYFLSLRSLIGMDLKFLGPVTPLGGLLLLAGWIHLLLYSISKKTKE